VIGVSLERGVLPRGIDRTGQNAAASSQRFNVTILDPSCRKLNRQRIPAEMGPSAAAGETPDIDQKADPRRLQPRYQVLQTSFGLPDSV
jgi:hypothetical protein